MSTRETVLEAVRTTLANASAVATLVGTRVYRTRREQLAALPAIEIEQSGINSEQVVIGRQDHTLDVTVTAYATAETPDSAPDAVLAAAHAALFADRTLGLGADVQIMPNYAAETPQVDGFDYGALAHRYQIFFRTAPTAI